MQVLINFGVCLENLVDILKFANIEPEFEFFFFFQYIRREIFSIVLLNPICNLVPLIGF